MASKLKTYLEDPFLSRLYGVIRRLPPLKSISVDLTHVCNIRCTGCYYFEQEMDAHVSPPDDEAFDALILGEKERGTNFVTIVGGEPSLSLPRLKKLYDNFSLSVATNGLKRIPREGFENLPLGVAVWGSHQTDRVLRGGGRLDVFKQALKNYRDDPRAFFYYTVAPGHAAEVATVVEECIQNGNRVLFNFYCDIKDLGGDYGYRNGFSPVISAIDAMIDRYPEWILLNSYFAGVITTGRLLSDRWGYETCTSISADNPVNADRIQNGKTYNRHFRAYNSDFTTTRRCCTGVDRDCDSCFDTWEHFSWVMLNMKKHLESKTLFTSWLTTTYLFYMINNLLDEPEDAALLPEIHRRTRGAGCV